MNIHNDKELEQITKQLDTLDISSDSDNSIYSNLTNYQYITTKKHDKIIEYVIDSLKLNNKNIALEVKMLSETLEKYKQLYYELQKKRYERLNILNSHSVINPVFFNK